MSPQSFSELLAKIDALEGHNNIDPEWAEIRLPLTRSCLVSREYCAISQLSAWLATTRRCCVTMRSRQEHPSNTNHPDCTIGMPIKVFRLHHHHHHSIKVPSKLLLIAISWGLPCYLLFNWTNSPHNHSINPSIRLPQSDFILEDHTICLLRSHNSGIVA